MGCIRKLVLDSLQCYCVICLSFFFNVHLFMVVLDLCCCVQAFSSCDWVTLVAVLGFLIVVASFVAASSVVVAHGLSCSVACGILPDQGSNPCPLNWQADS